MSKRFSSPHDPAAHEAALQRIRNMTREEWLERLRRYPDFEESWVKPLPVEQQPVKASREPRTVSIRRARAA